MAKLRVKFGVQPRLIDLVVAIGNVAASWALTDELWITSGIDAIHGQESLHYALRAIDVRTKNLPDQAAKEELVKRLKVELGPGYQVILEKLGTASEHIHLEFDRA